jgi:diacylglycerol kinase family enzyme
MRCALIYNPAAGTRREQRIDEVERAAARLRSLGHEALVIATIGPGSAGGQARDAVREGAEVVFACGGDGTVNEVLQGLVADTGNPRAALDTVLGAALGIIPLGSANALARQLRIPLDAERAVEEQIRGEWMTISVGKLEIGGQVQHFAVMVGAGPDGALVYELHSAGKSRMGRLAYALHAARIFAARRFSRFAIEYTEMDGTVRTLDVVSVMAARVDCLGGLFTGLVERGDAMDKQSLRLSLLRPPGLISLPLWFLTGWLGLRRVNPFLVEARAREFACRPVSDGGGPCDSDVHCEADGEWLGRIPMRVSVTPDALTVLAPRAACSASRAESGRQ